MYEVPYTIWVFFMYKASYIYGSILCIAPPILHKMVPIYIYNVIATIMGPSYVHQLLWGLTPVHKMVPIYIVSYVLLWVHLMYTGYCWVLLLWLHKMVRKYIE